jgi:hypothetical protein
MASSDLNSPCQSLSGDTFGPELRQVCELFRTESTVVTTALSTFAYWTGKDSSAQATVPLTCIPTLRSIISGGVGSLIDSYTRGKKVLVGGEAGLPLITEILDELCTLIRANPRPSRNCPVLRDCGVVLKFLDYLCDTVLLSYDPEMRARLLLRLSTDGWLPGAVSACGDGDPGTEEPVSHEYDTDGFLGNGIHMPYLKRNRWRGSFKKDAKASEETSSRDGGCDKPFPQMQGKTGVFLCHTPLILAQRFASFSKLITLCHLVLVYFFWTQCF